MKQVIQMNNELYTVQKFLWAVNYIETDNLVTRISWYIMWHSGHVRTAVKRVQL